MELLDNERSGEFNKGKAYWTSSIGNSKGQDPTGMSKDWGYTPCKPGMACSIPSSEGGVQPKEDFLSFARTNRIRIWDVKLTRPDKAAMKKVLAAEERNKTAGDNYCNITVREQILCYSSQSPS